MGEPNWFGEEDPDENLITDVVLISADLGVQELGNWFPAKHHDYLREALADMCYSAVIAFRDGKQNWFEVPLPSVN